MNHIQCTRCRWSGYAIVRHYELAHPAIWSAITDAGRAVVGGE